MIAAFAATGLLFSTASDAAAPARAAAPRVLHRTFRARQPVAAELYLPPEPPDARVSPPWTCVFFFPDARTGHSDYRAYGETLAAEGFIAVLLGPADPFVAGTAYANLRNESAQPRSPVFGRIAPGGFFCAGHGSGGDDALRAGGRDGAIGCAVFDPALRGGPGSKLLAPHRGAFLAVASQPNVASSSCAASREAVEELYASAWPPKYGVTVVGGGPCEFSGAYARCRRAGCPSGSIPPTEQIDLAARVLAGFLRVHATDGLSTPYRFLASLSSPRLLSRAEVR